MTPVATKVWRESFLEGSKHAMYTPVYLLQRGFDKKFGGNLGFLFLINTRKLNLTMRNRAISPASIDMPLLPARIVGTVVLLHARLPGSGSTRV